jgi:hypothetical protein
MPFDAPIEEEEVHFSQFRGWPSRTYGTTASQSSAVGGVHIVAQRYAVVSLERASPIRHEATGATDFHLMSDVTVAGKFSNRIYMSSWL